MKTFALTIDPFGAPDRWRVAAQLTVPKSVPSHAVYEFVYEFARRDGDTIVGENAELTSLQTDSYGYGTVLGQFVFAGAVGELFRHALDLQLEPLHVILDLRDSSLETIGWQRLSWP